MMINRQIPKLEIESWFRDNFGLISSTNEVNGLYNSRIMISCCVTYNRHVYNVYMHFYSKKIPIFFVNII